MTSIEIEYTSTQSSDGVDLFQWNVLVTVEYDPKNKADWHVTEIVVPHWIRHEFPSVTVDRKHRWFDLLNEGLGPDFETRLMDEIGDLEDEGGSDAVDRPDYSDVA